MKVTLDKIFRKEKEGSKGKYISVGLKTPQYPDKWINGFEDDTTKHWKDGDEVEIELIEKDGYLNFKTVGVYIGDAISKGTQLDRIEQKLNELLKYFESNRMYIEAKDKSYPYPSLKEAQIMNKEIPTSEMNSGDIDIRFKTQYPVDDINPDNTPF